MPIGIDITIPSVFPFQTPQLPAKLAPLLLSPYIAHNRSAMSLSSESSRSVSIVHTEFSRSESVIPIAVYVAPIAAVITIVAPPANAAKDEDEIFSKVRLYEDDWNVRLQDSGCTKDALPSNTYRRSHIPGMGPLGMEMYYYHLTSSAVDYLRFFQEENTLGRGWAKVPKNKSDAKLKIIGVILALRKENDDGTFNLDQTRILLMLSSSSQKKHLQHIQS